MTDGFMVTCFYSWGICDVEDCCAGALYLAEQKLADKQRLCIDGGSAGGYTTLACLAFKDVFKAGKRDLRVCHTFVKTAANE